MKLMQLNIWQGRLLRQALDFLEQEKPDILCMQEVYSSGINSVDLDFFGSFERIKELFPGYNGYFSANFDIPVFGQKVSYGNALISSFPLLKTETIYTSGEFHSFNIFGEFTEYEGENNRIAYNVQKVTVQTGEDKTFCLLNHHGYWLPNRMGSELSVEKMEIVADIIRLSPRPLIFVGDLNVVAESPAMKPIQSILHDLTQEYGLQTTLSELGKVKNVACDHVSISEGIKVQNFGTRNSLESDHKALVLEFDLS